jgi:hypothetical protein
MGNGPFYGKHDVRPLVLYGRDAAAEGDKKLRDHCAERLGRLSLGNGLVALACFAVGAVHGVLSMRQGGSAVHVGEGLYDATVGTLQAMSSYSQAFLRSQLLAREVAEPPAEPIEPDPLAEERKEREYVTNESLNDLGATTGLMMGFAYTASDATLNIIHML